VGYKRKIMKILFIISIGLVIFAVFNYDKISRKAMYKRNKENDTGYYWGGIPRNQKTINEEQNRRQK
jgi:hypothetical protein